MNTAEVQSEEGTCVSRARKALKTVVEARSLKSGDLLFQQGDSPRAVFFLLTGLVELRREGLGPAALCVARPGDVIGVTFAISGRPYDMDAVAMKPSKVEMVDRNVFRRLMTSSSGLHIEVVRMLSVDLGRCYEILRTLGPKTRNRGSEEVTL